MNNAYDIEAEFRDRAVERGGLLLFRPRDAIDMIRRSRNARIKVLGVDAFRDLPGGVVQPMMEESIDLSTPQNRNLLLDSWRHAEDFVHARRETPFLFEIVLEKPPIVFPDDETLS